MTSGSVVFRACLGSPDLVQQEMWTSVKGVTGQRVVPSWTFQFEPPCLTLFRVKSACDRSTQLRRGFAADIYIGSGSR